MSRLTPTQRALAVHMAVHIMARGHRVYIVALAAAASALFIPLDEHPLIGGLMLGTVIALGTMWCGIYLCCEVMSVAADVTAAFVKLALEAKENGNGK